jgi:hypothetical protein
LKIVFSTIFLIFSWVAFSQETQNDRVKDSLQLAKDYKIAIKPTKVGFYSAILPGLGQGYNKKYWKIPIVYIAIAAPTYLYINNSNKYKAYRNDYKKKKLGDESVTYSFDQLKRAQEFHKKKRDGNMLAIAAVYILQIVEASVDAHLQHHNINDQLSFSPQILKNPKNGNAYWAVSMSFRF